MNQETEVQASVNVEKGGPIKSVYEDVGVNPSETSKTLHYSLKA